MRARHSVALVLVLVSVAVIASLSLLVKADSEPETSGEVAVQSRPPTKSVLADNALAATEAHLDHPEERATDVLPAFPGAEGFGSTTPGGRDGRVIEVTSLDDEGPGSLREACRASGPRVILFRVGGTIHLKDEIVITEPFATIAGQTAPGDGICLRGAGLVISTHDVIVRGLRIRVGDDRNGPDPEMRDGIRIGVATKKEAEQLRTLISRAGGSRPDDSLLPRPVHDVIVDHCSVSWAIDENMDVTHPAHDVTIQWCVISEALFHSLHPKGPHSMGLLIIDHSKRVTVHHCLFAHNSDRHPQMKGGTETEVINNVAYDYIFRATSLRDPEGSGPYKANIIGNHYIPGRWHGSGTMEVGIDFPKPGSAVYLDGNIGPHRPTEKLDQRFMLSGGLEWLSSEPAVEPSGVTTQSAADARDLVLENAGATVPHRDSVDERAVSDTQRQRGHVIDSPRQVGGWPLLKDGPAPPDSDHDGMPDEWERTHDLDPADPSDGVALAPSGYTWVEEYINSLIPMPGLR